MNRPASTVETQRVVIVGGGFAGLTAARALRRAPVAVTLIDRRNYHLFQPLLYQVATGTLSPGNIAAPLRSVLKRQLNVRVLLGEVVAIDAGRRMVVLADGEVPYDTLIVATGSQYNYFGHDWEPLAPSLKSIEDATEIRRRILGAFERAERAASIEERRRLLTFVIVGGGPTGVELAGALAEIARNCVPDYRQVRPADVSIMLVEAQDRILGSFDASLSERALKSLAGLGVAVRTRCLVTDILPNEVQFDCGGEQLASTANNLFWTAGVKASDLSWKLAAAIGAEQDRAGRIIVGPELTITGHPEIFVLGDMAHCSGPDGVPLPGLAPVAMQQAKYAARTITARLRGKPVVPFRYRDPGTMATIGRSAAVVDLHGWRFNGFAAWITWLVVHLLQIVTFQNRLLVLIQWAWHYLTFNRSAQLITLREPPSEGSQQSTMDQVH